jgi:hypothetical protein
MECLLLGLLSLGADPFEKERQWCIQFRRHTHQRGHGNAGHASLVSLNLLETDTDGFAQFSLAQAK